MKPRKRHSAVKDRSSALTQRRNKKMARSAHAYVRGNTLKFYEWLQDADATLPQGPPVWICGDCHVGNLGPVANADGEIAIQIRDLDQTVIGNPAHDLVRLGLSLATAARGSDLPGIATAQMLEHMILGYEQAFQATKRGGNFSIERPESVQIAMRRALKRKWKHLARERIEDTHPDIPLGKRFWPISSDEKKALRQLFEDKNTRKLVTLLRSRDNDADIELLDAAYWMKGCSSLGRLRYAALISIGGKNGELCLIDIKEAIQPAAPRNKKGDMPRDNAQRVVTGAQHLAPYLGERMLAAQFMDRSVFLRELLPQDMKLEIERLTLEEARKAAWFLAMVVGKAHARQMDSKARTAWHKELGRNRSKSLDAPSWLWLSVVDLVASHERAYLEHCRRYATGQD